MAPSVNARQGCIIHAIARVRYCMQHLQDNDRCGHNPFLSVERSMDVDAVVDVIVDVSLHNN